MGVATVRSDFAPLRFLAVAAKTSGDILLSTGNIDRPHIEIGVIFVKGRCFTSFEKVMEEMKEKAREVGADAVIKIEFGGTYGYHFRHSCRGLAGSFNYFSIPFLPLYNFT